MILCLTSREYCVSDQEGKRHIMDSFKRVELGHDAVILTCTSNIETGATYDRQRDRRWTLTHL